jgi:hypothetical protein
MTSDLPPWRRRRSSRAPAFPRYAGMVRSRWYLVCSPFAFSLIRLLIVGAPNL